MNKLWDYLNRKMTSNDWKVYIVVGATVAFEIVYITLTIAEIAKKLF